MINQLHRSSQAGMRDGPQPAERSRFTYSFQECLSGRCSTGRLLCYPGHDSRARHSLAIRTMVCTERLTSNFVVAQELTLIRIQTRPCHTEPLHQQVPSFCSASRTARVTSSDPNDTST